MAAETEEVLVAEEMDLSSSYNVCNVNSKSPYRPFVFAEFFAGLGGLSNAMSEIDPDRVTVAATLDGYAGQWDILNDEHYQVATDLVENIDHGHFAPPCRTLTSARRSDEYGTAKILRSEDRPEGWGDKEAVLANAVVARMVILCLKLAKRGSTFAIENPWLSYIWLLSVMQKLYNLPNIDLLLIHQCAYGAVTTKPTGILTTASWMKLVKGLCHETREHYHAPGGLTGFAWDFLADKEVWRTSLAAEYPCGLCLAWASALKGWLSSGIGDGWLKGRSYHIVGRWKNILVRLNTSSMDGSSLSEDKKTSREVRELENKKAWGGLRNPRHAVKNSSHLREVGSRIRQIIDNHVSLKDAEDLDRDIRSGLDPKLVLRVRNALAEEFGATIEEDGLQADLWRKILTAARDPDAAVLPSWMANGFPLGIEEKITNTGIFPATDADSAAVEASRLEGQLLVDTDGSAVNYRSFEEAGGNAQDLLDQMVTAGRSEVFDTWDQVVEAVGAARLTKMACIVKAKETGELKYRLVVDSRRSGVNGLMEVRERVILPKVTDFISSVQHLLQQAEDWPDHSLELFGADFKDAFHMLPLCPAERKYAVCKDLHGKYHVSKVVVFGLAPGPLLWARLASAAMRVSQAVVAPFEAAVACYVDDPLLAIMGRNSQERTRVFIYYALTWLSLGLELSWKKADRGQQVQWIGFSMSLSGRQNGDVTVQLTDQKRKKLMEVFDQLLQCKGVLPLKLLQLAVGVIGWASSVMPMSRPWLAMLWAAVTQQRHPIRQTTRARKGLVFVKQVDHAIRWLYALVKEVDDRNSSCLKRTFRWRPRAQTILVQTDACPEGMGGFLMIGKEFVAYWWDEVTEADLKLLGAQKGDPSYQTEWEMLAVWISLELFCPLLVGDDFSTQILLRTDNTATIQAAIHHKASSPLMIQLAAEVALQIEAFGLLALFAQHVPGVLNEIADRLSRMGSNPVLPHQLRNVRQLWPPARTPQVFRAWPK